MKKDNHEIRTAYRQRTYLDICYRIEVVVIILYYFEVARYPTRECFSYKHEVLKNATIFSLPYRDNSCRFISKIQLTTTFISVVVTV